jgi:hypothetical protein
MTEYTTFACYVGEANLCLFNSTCNGLPLGSGQACVCAPGYVHDNTFFHSQNCGLPELYMKVFVPVYSFVWFLILLLLMQKTRHNVQRKKNIAWLTRITFAYHFSIELFLILLVIQEGVFEGAIVFLASMLWTMTVLIAQIIKKTFAFKHGMYAERVEEVLIWVNRVAGVYLLFCLAFIAAAIPVCRTEMYDVVLLIFISLHVTFLCIVAVIAVAFTTGLMRDLEKNSRMAENQELQAVYIRLRTMRCRWAFCIINMMFAGVGGVTLRVVLRSLPFTFIITTLVWFNALFLTLVS